MDRRTLLAASSTWRVTQVAVWQIGENAGGVRWCCDSAADQTAMAPREPTSRTRMPMEPGRRVMGAGASRGSQWFQTAAFQGNRDEDPMLHSCRVVVHRNTACIRL